MEARTGREPMLISTFIEIIFIRHDGNILRSIPSNVNEILKHVEVIGSEYCSIMLKIIKVISALANVALKSFT